ncbi:MAG: hypothetical protein ACLGRW_07405 [Acidobacteriota bacterium]
MFLRSHQRSKDGKAHTYWSLVETVRTSAGPAENPVFSGRIEWIGAGAVAEDDRAGSNNILRKTGWF